MTANPKTRRRAPKKSAKRRRQMMSISLRTAVPTRDDLLVDHADKLCKDGVPVEPSRWLVTMAWEWSNDAGEPTPLIGVSSCRATFVMTQDSKPTEQQRLTRLRETLTSSEGGWTAEP